MACDDLTSMSPDIFYTSRFGLHQATLVALLAQIISNRLSMV